MSVGKGDGERWGGGALVQGDPAARIGAPYTVFNFDDEVAPGPFPGVWSFYRAHHDGMGAVVLDEEPSPLTFFSVVPGEPAHFNYSSSPPLPPMGTPFVVRGQIAAPQGVLVGRNVRIDAILRAPPRAPYAPDGTPLDEFFFHVCIGCRAVERRFAFSGLQMHARWDGALGRWDVPATLEIVRADDADPVVIASLTPEEGPDDLQTVLGTGTFELSLEARGSKLVAEMGGRRLEADVPFASPDAHQPIVLVGVGSRVGSVVTPYPALLSLRLQTFHDLDRLGPAAEIIGEHELFQPRSGPMVLPIADMLAKGVVTREGARHFVFTQDVEVSGQYGYPFLFDAGNVVKSIETYSGQYEVPVVVDLGRERARRK